MGRNDKVASATVTTPLPNSPLCDDTWQAYIFALDLDEDGQNAKKWNSFYDLVANGTRQRFSVLSKAAALAWAGENAKNYDTCKEVKAILDSGGAQAEIPDALLARLVKMKLLALKLEGIEQRNAAKVAKETAETSAPVPEPADAAKGKPAKKDDKEKEKEKEKEKASEKDRAKSSNKKVTKGASNKQQEAPSRPESARAAPETSLRKNKLRDRGVVKTDTKPTAIGDEPENGPDAYYLLRDFPTPGFYTCLMDENGVQLNLFLTLDDSNGSEGQRPGDGGSPDSGVGSRRGSAWPVARAAPESSLWKNVPFRSIATSNLPEDTDVFDVAAKEIYKLLEVRNIYESFYSNDRIISIPELEETKLYSSLRYFDYLMTSVPSEPMINSDVLLALMLEQVARMAPSKGEEGGSPGVVLPAKAEEIQALKRYFETASSNLIPTREEGEGKDVMVDDQSTARPVCSWADSHAAITSLMRPAPNEEFHISAALADLRKNFTAGRLMSAIRRLNETGVMNPGAAVRDQLVWASRIQSVKGATIQDTEEANRLLRQKEFETLLSESKASSITSLRDWTCIESLDEDAFAQVLETTRVTYPVTRIRYSDRENGVLIALTGPGAAGALEANRHSTFQARTKVGFGLFAQLHQSQPKLLQHETATSSPYVYSVGDRVLEFEESNHYVYPTAEGYIKHERLRAREGTTDTCLSIHWDSGMLSWRRGKSNGKTELIASFNDGSVMSFISEGPGSSATVHVSTPDGQTVAWDAQGGITQKLNAARKRSFSKGSFGEFGRHIRPDVRNGNQISPKWGDPNFIPGRQRIHTRLGGRLDKYPKRWIPCDYKTL
ncbi:uncharacterized protein EV422DRAFT_276647 [Fimicolochytrium jonesii]|uniref:uncharacterized protein n=1 Tax=Fimicolochytrium jonesii TaxID=1396493 RepID=UPI0022FE0EAD|nr:uncharacterized protein EV422DRAFT_276647 [Fimicolochytrium jonesii]KAI8816725.1 hypothetical protein EV422DRAFT_276647 [Fimicolochytrium jonesii]